MGQAATAPAPKSFRFLDLPTELRLEVYERTLQIKHHKINIRRGPTHHGTLLAQEFDAARHTGYVTLIMRPIPVALLRTCKLVYEEAHAILYRSLRNEIVADNWSSPRMLVDPRALHMVALKHGIVQGAYEWREELTRNRYADFSSFLAIHGYADAYKEGDQSAVEKIFSFIGQAGRLLHLVSEHVEGPGHQVSPRRPLMMIAVRALPTDNARLHEREVRLSARALHCALRLEDAPLLSWAKHVQLLWDRHDLTFPEVNRSKWLKEMFQMNLSGVGLRKRDILAEEWEKDWAERS